MSITNLFRWRRVVLILVLLVSSLVMWNILSHVENWKRDLTTNQAHLDPQASDPVLRPLTLQATPAQVADTIQHWATDQPRWSVESRQQQGATITMELSHRTALLRFIDDIHVVLSSTDQQGTLVEAESRSRIGKGDLGQNPRNLRALVAALRAAHHDLDRSLDSATAGE
jgi:uncharacterized protein (DUF1499 family)